MQELELIEGNLMNNGTCLYKSKPIPLNPELALLLGDSDQAIILQQIHYWLNMNREATERGICSVDVHKEGRIWCFQTLDEWEANFYWLSRSTIQRKLNALEKSGLLIKGKKGFNKMAADRTIWYTINYTNLKKMSDEFSEKHKDKIAKIEANKKKRKEYYNKYLTGKRAVSEEKVEQSIDNQANGQSETLPNSQNDNLANVQSDYLPNGQNDNLPNSQNDHSNNKRLTIQETNLQEINLQETKCIQLVSQSSQSSQSSGMVFGVTDRHDMNIRYITDLITDLKLHEISTIKSCGIIKEIELCMIEMYVLKDGIVVDGTHIPVELVRSVLSKLNQSNIEYVVEKFLNLNHRITNNKAYLKSMIYNSAFETDSHHTNDYNCL